MSESTHSQAQQAKGPSAEAFDPFKAGQEELARLQAKGFEVARTAIDELTRLAHATLAYSAQMSAEWQRMTTEATRKMSDLVKPAAKG